MDVLWNTFAPLYERAFIRTKRQAKIIHFYYRTEDTVDIFLRGQKGGIPQGSLF
jgi:hypothetical protein